jgi:hypothetical protein
MAGIKDAGPFSVFLVVFSHIREIVNKSKKRE